MDSSEDEMNVYLKVIKTVAFKVKRSETTKELKALFNEKEGTPENLQELFFTGKQLKDDHKLVDYGIGTNSTLDLYLQAIDRIKILVYLPSNEKTLELDAKSHETVRNIKLLIQTEEGIPSEQFTLFYGGELLEDDRTLASLRIQSASMLYLVPNPRDVVSVSVRMQSGDILRLKVKVLHTVQDLKAIVQSMVGFVVGGKDLTYEGKLLEDSKTLASCNIKENSLLEMLPLTIKIYVTGVKRKTLVLRVFKENKVLDVKNLISDMKGVPVENIRLISDPDDDRENNSRKMENDQELAFYNVGENSELSESLEMFVLFCWALGKVLICLCSRVGSGFLTSFQAHCHHHLYQTPPMFSKAKLRLAPSQGYDKMPQGFTLQRLMPCPRGVRIRCTFLRISCKAYAFSTWLIDLHSLSIVDPLLEMIKNAYLIPYTNNTIERGETKDIHAQWLEKSLTYSTAWIDI